MWWEFLSFDCLLSARFSAVDLKLKLILQSNVVQLNLFHNFQVSNCSLDFTAIFLKLYIFPHNTATLIFFFFYPHLKSHKSLFSPILFLNFFFSHARSRRRRRFEWKQKQQNFDKCIQASYWWCFEGAAWSN